MAKPDPSELFRQLVPHYCDDAYIFAKSGDDMACMASIDPDSYPEVYLLNLRIQKAWQLVGEGRMTWWNCSDIEVASLHSLPADIREGVFGLEVSYSMEIKDYADGVALVEWTFVTFPDDKDDYVETSLFAYIDTNASVIIPFQPMDEALKEQYRRQAVDIMSALNDPDRMVEYVCLQPGLTIPATENRNLAVHIEFLSKVIGAAMYRFQEMARNLDHYPDNHGVFGIDTVLNPGPEHISLLLTGIQMEDDTQKFDVRVQLALSRPGCPPRASQAGIGIYTVEQICASMTNTDNAVVLINHLISTAAWLYSDEPGVPYAQS